MKRGRQRIESIANPQSINEGISSPTQACVTISFRQMHKKERFYTSFFTVDFMEDSQLRHSVKNCSHRNKSIPASARNSVSRHRMNLNISKLDDILNDCVLSSELSSYMCLYCPLPQHHSKSLQTSTNTKLLSLNHSRSHDLC